MPNYFAHPLIEARISFTTYYILRISLGLSSNSETESGPEPTKDRLVMFFINFFGSQVQLSKLWGGSGREDAINIATSFDAISLGSTFFVSQHVQKHDYIVLDALGSIANVK